MRLGGDFTEMKLFVRETEDHLRSVNGTTRQPSDDSYKRDRECSKDRSRALSYEADGINFDVSAIGREETESESLPDAN